MQESVDDLIVFLLLTTILILVMGSFILCILLIYRKRQLSFQKDIDRIRHEYEKNLLRTQLEIQEQTIHSISREIHDNITLTLTLAKLHLNTIKPTNDKLNEQVSSSIGFVGKAISDLSDISRSLNSDVIIEQGLISALQLEIDKLGRLNKFNIELEISGLPVYMDAQRELFIFRIIQEAFNNILKHANADNVSLILNYIDHQVIIFIKDDGIGFSQINATNCTVPTAGLLNMKKRAELINGTLEIKSENGEGTEICLSIPLTQ